LLANNCRDALRFEARGFTRINIKIDKIASHIIFYPPIEEQQAIADYLDEKTAEIDEQISNIDKKINTYKRLKQSLIDEVVTGKRKI
jgi:type I restriction enzyme S subunit